MIVLSLRYMLAICSAGVFVFVGNAYSRDVYAYSQAGMAEVIVSMCVQFVALFAAGYYFLKTKINLIDLFSVCILASSLTAFSQMSGDLSKRSDISLAAKTISDGGGLVEVSKARKENPNNVYLRGLEEIFLHLDGQQKVLQDIFSRNPIQSEECLPKAFSQNQNEFRVCSIYYSSLHAEIDKLHSDFLKKVDEHKASDKLFNINFNNRYSEEALRGSSRRIFEERSNGVRLIVSFMETDSRFMKQLAMLFSFLDRTYGSYAVNGNQFIFTNEKLMGEYISIQSEVLQLGSRVDALSEQIKKGSPAK